MPSAISCNSAGGRRSASDGAACRFGSAAVARFVLLRTVGRCRVVLGVGSRVPGAGLSQRSRRCESSGRHRAGQSVHLTFQSPQPSAGDQHAGAGVRHPAGVLDVDPIAVRLDVRSLWPKVLRSVAQLAVGQPTPRALNGEVLVTLSRRSTATRSATSFRTVTSLRVPPSAGIVALSPAGGIPSDAGCGLLTIPAAVETSRPLDRWPRRAHLAEPCPGRTPNPGPPDRDER